MSDEGKRVLIVDDDDGIRRSLARIMRCKGFVVETACDGESAVEIAKRFEPQLLILDIRMPGIDGVETFERIRSDRPEVPAIFMTAYSASSRVTEAFEQGAVSVLSKPLDVEALVEMVEHSLVGSPVLIVDEDTDFLNRVAVKLKAKGIEISTTRSMEAAVRSLQQRPRQVVIVIGKPPLPDGYSLPELADGVRWIPKPIDVDALVHRVDQIAKASPK